MEVSKKCAMKNYWWANPIMILCMGGEMLYILDQRLAAQDVNKVKSAKVIEDIMKSMYGSRILGTLFKQYSSPLYQPFQARKKFYQIAHSSIMRLNEQSMDKLFDLMCMGLKHQTISCREPHELLAITLNHLDAVSKIASRHGLSKNIKDLIESCRERFLCLYSIKTFGEMWTIRQAILQSLQCKIIKVSLLLSHRMQNNDGFIVLPINGQQPRGVEIPGVVRHYSNGQMVASDDLPLIISNTHRSDVISPLIGQGRQHNNIIAALQEYCILGENMYSNKKKRKQLKKNVREIKSPETSRKRSMTTASLQISQLERLLPVSSQAENPLFSINISLDATDTNQSKNTTFDIFQNRNSKTKEMVDNIIAEVGNLTTEDDENDLLALMDGL